MDLYDIIALGLHTWIELISTVSTHVFLSFSLFLLCFLWIELCLQPKEQTLREVCFEWRSNVGATGKQADLATQLMCDRVRGQRKVKSWCMTDLKIKHTAEFRSAVLAHLRKDQLMLVLKLERFFCGARLIDFRVLFFGSLGILLPGFKKVVLPVAIIKLFLATCCHKLPFWHRLNKDSRN